MLSSQTVRNIRQ